MNDTQLEMYITVVEAGSFTKAEEKLFVSKQAILKQITNLEHELGVTLLQRNRRGVSMSEEGKIFYDGAKSLLQQKQELSMRLLQKSGKNILRIGSAQHQVLLDPVIEEFSRKYPEIIIERIVHPNHSGEYRVENDIQDVAESFITDSHMNEMPYDFIPLMEASFFVVMDVKHPLHTKQEITLEDLEKYPVIVFPMMLNQMYLDELEHVYQNHQDDLIKSDEVDHQVETIFSLSGTDHVIVGANPFVKSLKGFKVIPLAKDWKRTYGVICRHEQSVPVRLFIELAKQIYKTGIEV